MRYIHSSSVFVDVSLSLCFPVRIVFTCDFSYITVWGYRSRTLPISRFHINVLRFASHNLYTCKRNCNVQQTLFVQLFSYEIHLKMQYLILLVALKIIRKNQILKMLYVNKKSHLKIIIIIIFFHNI